MSSTYGEGPNAEAIEAWDTVLFEKYVRFRDIMCGDPAIHSDRARRGLDVRPGMRVLDLGCGFGDTAEAFAAEVGETGSVVGLDSSPHFIDVARRESKRKNVRFDVADAQTGDLGGPYDIVFSRFGLMFVASPVQSFRNIARSLAPGGRLCAVVWRKREDNEVVHIAETVVREILPEKEEKTDAVTCGPGPFALAGADMVSDQLMKAGYEKIRFERSDVLIKMGDDVESAIEFAMALGPAGEIIRLAGEEGVRKGPEAVQALRKAFEGLRGADGAVRARSSCWIITASPRQDK